VLKAGVGKLGGFNISFILEKMRAMLRNPAQPEMLPFIVRKIC